MSEQKAEPEVEVRPPLERGPQPVRQHPPDPIEPELGDNARTLVDSGADKDQPDTKFDLDFFQPLFILQSVLRNLKHLPGPDGTRLREKIAAEIERIESLSLPPAGEPRMNLVSDVNLLAAELSAQAADLLARQSPAGNVSTLSDEIFERLDAIAQAVRTANEEAVVALQRLLDGMRGARFATFELNTRFVGALSGLLDVLQHGLTCPNADCGGVGRPRWDSAPRAPDGVFTVEHTAGKRFTRHGSSSTFPVTRVVPLVRKKPGRKRKSQGQ